MTCGALRLSERSSPRLSFTFVTDGVEPAITMARRAAGKRRVTVIGGPSTFQQCIAAALADELQLRLIPRMLGRGVRLFKEVGRTDLRFRLQDRG